MEQAFKDVREFMQVGSQATPDALTPVEPTPDLSGVVATLREAEVLLASLESTTEANKLAMLRVRLMLEELTETTEALTAGDMVGFADGLADLLYVTVGAAVAYGIPLPAVWNEVQRANMTKFPTCPNCSGRGYYEDESDVDLLSTNSECASCNGHGRVAIRDAGGKVQKPPGWTPPNIAHVLFMQGKT